MKSDLIFEIVIVKKIKLNKLGRNEACHCGSGNKYKRCCLPSDTTFPQDIQQMSKSIQLKSRQRQRSRIKNNIGDNCIVLQGEIDGIKMSEVIIDIADFLLKVAHTKARLESAIAITCVAWNMAVVGPEKGREIFDAYFKQMDDPLHQQDLLDIVSAVIKRKQAYYPDINRVILDYELAGTVNNLHLNIVSTVPEETVAQLKQEQITNLLGN